MPGKRFNFLITGGALQGLRARLVRLEPYERATVQVQNQPGQAAIPQAWMKRLRQKSTNPKKHHAKRRRRP